MLFRFSIEKNVHFINENSNIGIRWPIYHGGNNIFACVENMICSNPIANALELMQSYTKPSSSWWRHMLTVSVTVNYLEIPPRGHSICSRLAHLIAYSYDPKYLFHLRKFYIAEMQTKQIVLVFPV